MNDIWKMAAYILCFQHTVPPRWKICNMFLNIGKALVTLKVWFMRTVDALQKYWKQLTCSQLFPHCIHLHSSSQALVIKVNTSVTQLAQLSMQCNIVVGLILMQNSARNIFLFHLMHHSTQFYIFDQKIKQLYSTSA